MRPLTTPGTGIRIQCKPAGNTEDDLHRSLGTSGMMAGALFGRYVPLSMLRGVADYRAKR
jgi:hypothetical protein